MRIKFSVLAAVSSMSLAAFATPAFAGGCVNGAPNCNVGVNVIAPAPAQFGPMTVHTNHPMGHLRQVDFQRSPNVSITRIHGMASTAGLSDAPSGFTGGCFPTSTHYCRTDAGTPINIDFAPAPAPVVAAPYVPAPTYRAPVPVQPLRTVIGQGYDPSKFAPRQYGDNTFTPGIAHVPTSYVDRSPANAQAALNSGRAIQQPLANGGMTPAYGQTMPLMGGIGYAAPAQQYVTLPDTMAPAMGMDMGMGGVGYSAPAQRVVTLPDTMIPSMGMDMGMGGVGYSAPAQRVVTLPDTMVSGMGGYSAPQMAPMMGRQATAPVLTQNGTYASHVGADGTYWEKTSGPTMFGNTMATQVICKRKLPTQVVNPVVNVPYAVPTAVPTCGPVPHGMHPGHNTRYGQQNSRWVR